MVKKEEKFSIFFCSQKPQRKTIKKESFSIFKFIHNHARSRKDVVNSLTTALELCLNIWGKVSWNIIILSRTNKDRHWIACVYIEEQAAEMRNLIFRPRPNRAKWEEKLSLQFRSTFILCVEMCALSEHIKKVQPSTKWKEETTMRWWESFLVFLYSWEFKCFGIGIEMWNSFSVWVFPLFLSLARHPISIKWK